MCPQNEAYCKRSGANFLAQPLSLLHRVARASDPSDAHFCEFAHRWRRKTGSTFPHDALEPGLKRTSSRRFSRLAHLSPQDLLNRFAELGIAADTVEHEPVFTVAESRPIKARIPGAHSKNLFVKDKKGRFFLISAKDETAIDLKRLHETIGASGRVSFGSADQMRALLGVEPGSVTAFAVVNDREGQVTMILDANLMEHERVNFHPLINSMTTGISRDDLVRFLRSTGHEPRILRLPEPQPELSDGPQAPM
jgi:Ala-tRNA(Pro) deacylase